MNTRTLALVMASAALAACTPEPSIAPGPDLPGERGMVPSLVDDARARAEGVDLTPEQARARVDEFTVTNRDGFADWPVDRIAFSAFQADDDRLHYIRRALGRYGLIAARERGLGTRLEEVRRVARITSPATAGEWWTRDVHRGDLLPGQRGTSIDLPGTISATVDSSFQIAAFGDLPAIRGTAIQEARGRFTPEFFADVSRDDRSDWATSPATAAGADRALTTEVDAEFGVRSRLPTGGEVSVSQRFTTTDTNRTSFIPGEQTGAETNVTYVQPLLRGGGFRYNDGPRRIANMDTQVAVEEFRRQAEAHLLEVERAYWNLYVARAVFVQSRHLAGHGRQIAGQIAGRAAFDADPILAGRAQSLAARWQADTVRAQAAVDNAEFRLAALVNDRRYGPGGVELLPVSAPNGALQLLSTRDTIEWIFTNRPELQQAILQYQAALLREGMAANESLPELDLVLEVRAAGGADGTDLRAALANEDGGFGSLIGLKFSIPLGFDERDARYHRRRLERVQQERQVMSAIATVMLEVDVAANEYIVACNDLVAQRAALVAAQRDTRALQARFDQGVSGAGIDLLSALLSSYESLQSTEQEVAQARATREVAAANLARARGLTLERWGLRLEITNDVRGEATYRLVEGQ
ncbi:MAG: TolC family protein [Paracoccaceae bacterium]